MLKTVEYRLSTNTLFGVQLLTKMTDQWYTAHNTLTTE